jgi:hypothetical protein
MRDGMRRFELVMNLVVKIIPYFHMQYSSAVSEYAQ